MIDYGIVTRRDENAIDMQSFKDELGYAALDGYVDESFNAMSAAMYALGVTICVMRGLLSQTDVDSLETTHVPAKIGAVVVEVSVPTTVTLVKKRLPKLLSKEPVLRHLLVDSQLRAQSFWQLLEVRKTRQIYNSMVKKKCSCLEMAICIQGYFRYRVCDIADLIVVTGGKCMYWFETCNQTLRLLREYNSPGSWFVPCSTCTSIDELLPHITEDSPRTIAYCFTGTLTFFTKNTRRIQRVYD